MECLLDCHQFWLESRTRDGSGSVGTCYVAVTDEFSENPKYWATAATTYYFENGTYTVTISIDPGPHADGCPAVDIESTFDPELNYGAGTEDPSTTYSQAVSPPSSGAAISAITWEDWSEPSSEIGVTVGNWHGGAFSLDASLETTLDGFTAIADARQQQWRFARGYDGLPITLRWTEAGSTYSITVPTGGSWSDLVTVAGAGNTIEDAAIYVGRYI